MPNEKNNSRKQIKLHYPIIGSFKSVDYKFIFYSILAMLAFGISLNSMSYYSGASYNIALSILALFIFVLTAKIEFINRCVNFWIFNLFFSTILGIIFFILKENVQDFNLIIFVLSIAVFSLVALLKASEDASGMEEKKIISVKRLIEVCWKSEGFRLISVLSFWLIFFVMLQSFFLAMGSNMSTSGLAIIDGAIVSFLFSLIIISIAMILSTRKVKKRLSTMLLFFILSAISILSWIIASSLIFAIELRLV